MQDEVLAHIVKGLMELGVDGLSPSVLVQATGHSLGGSLGMLCAYDLAGQGCSAACITFGSPKVGERKFVDSYNAIVGRTVRFVNKFDPVARLPPNDDDPVRDDADLLHSG